MKTDSQNHTPGPWAVKSSNGFPMSIIGGDSEIIADCSNHRLPGIALANARLISSAPDLLFALEHLVDHIDSLPSDDEKCLILKSALNNRSGDLIFAAIRKAKGEA